MPPDPLPFIAADGERIPLAAVNLDDVESVVLRRLIAEVRTEAVVGVERYDRTYNRHNRG